MGADKFREANKPSSVFKHHPMMVQKRRIIYLGPRLLDVSSSLPGTLDAVRTWRGPRLVPYLALLRVGFTVPRLLPARAVVSYTTVSPLPVPLTRPSAVCSLWYFPSPCDARLLAGTLPCGARTFLES